MTHEWDDLPRPASNYQKFENVGDNLVGTITRIGKGTDMNGNPVPELDVTTADGDETTVSAGQAMLKRLLLDALPKVGDRIAITFTGTEQQGRGTMKVFEVAVKAGDGAATDEPALASAARPSAADLL